MSRKAFFVKSKMPAFEHSLCDKCGLLIRAVQDGDYYWNPNPRARDRNICTNCFNVWQAEKAASWKNWRDKHEALTQQEEPA